MSTPSDPDLLSTSDAGPAAIRGGTVRIAGYVAGVVLNVVSAALLFRYLGVDDTGRYVTVLALVAIVGGVSDAGLTAIGVRELSVRTGPSRDALARNLLGLRVVLTLAGLAIAVGFAIAADYGEVLVVGTVLAGLGLLLQSVQQTFGIALMSRLALGWVTTADLLRQAIAAAGIVILVVAGASLLGFFVVPIVASAAMLALTVVLVRGDIPLLPAFHPVEWRALVRDVLPYSIAVVAGVLYFRIAVLLVSLVASDYETGIFGASFRILDVLVAIPGLMLTAAFPIFSRAARDDRNRLGYSMDRVFRVAAICGGAMCVALFLGAPVAIDVVAGSDFDEAVGVLQIQSVALALTFLGAFWGYAMLSLRMHREILMINLSALAIVSVLVTVLASADGARGAAIATTVAEALVAIMYPVVLLRGHADIVPSAWVLVPVVGAALVAGAAIALPLAPVFQTAIGLAVYLGLIVVLRAVPDEIKDELRRLRGADPPRAPA